MTNARYDVVGLGNAIVDVISQTDDDFLADWGIIKNNMNLIEADRADALTRASKNALETSGGSGANTIAGIASLGGRAAYIGKVADDRLGKVFRDDMASIGVPF
ncbi:MAG: adenosine kinase, partial [Alphaproteobacteria bacterium]|nr:adenosine kinase [Alphaproteobacteria bacterium]